MTAKITAFDQQIPTLLRYLENGLRSGHSVRQCLEMIARDLPEPAADEVQQVMAELDGGTAVPAALHNWLNRTPSEDLNLVVATFLVQFETGGNLADKFNLLGQIMAKRIRLT
ncbi:MAG: type II secretion system F family protein [Chloroflexi bacterium]|nr:type II secretion system F family protein [Chloroflexota bacterium]